MKDIIRMGVLAGVFGGLGYLLGFLPAMGIMVVYLFVTSKSQADK